MPQQMIPIYPPNLSHRELCDLDRFCRHQGTPLELASALHEVGQRETRRRLRNANDEITDVTPFLLDASGWSLTVLVESIAALHLRIDAMSHVGPLGPLKLDALNELLIGSDLSDEDRIALLDLLSDDQAPELRRLLAGCLRHVLTISIVRADLDQDDADAAALTASLNLSSDHDHRQQPAEISHPAPNNDG